MTNDQLTLSDKIEEMVKESVEHLRSQLRVEMYSVESHQVLIVSGWNDSDANIEAIAKYLVGLRATAVNAAMEIRARLFDNTPQGYLDLTNCVDSIVGATSSALNRDKIEDERNPWIAEAIWHLCMLLSNHRPELHPPGQIHALELAHVKPKDHGMDGLALYIAPDGALGLSIIESKAYKNEPNKAISKAVKFFREVESDKHSDRIRYYVTHLRTSLPQHLQSLVSGMFWTRTRAYFPNPHYDASESINWTNKRPSFPNYLSISKDNIIIMPNIIDEFDGFFDRIADKMRSISRGI